MIGSKLSVDMHVATCDTPMARNIMLAVERGRLKVEAMVATPYAAGLSTLVDDEAEMGATVIDMGGGTTSVGVFSAGILCISTPLGVGGHHVTMDVARGLTMRMSDAERLKALHAPALRRQRMSVRCSPSSRWARMAEMTPASDAKIEPDAHHPTARGKKSSNWCATGWCAQVFGAETGRRIVLTGGAAQLTGLTDMVRRVISPHVRIGRPVGVQGLPDSAKSPAFAATVGLLIYPQFARIEHFEPTRSITNWALTGTGYFARMGNWLRESF